MSTGITPAWAGKRFNYGVANRHRRDHTRMGGEKSDQVILAVCREGSPPHGRGKDFLVQHRLFSQGITPAWAGKSPSASVRSGWTWDHPRMGGEKKRRALAVSAFLGSPPRGRGKDGESTGIGGADGITPAWAGKRFPARPQRHCKGDHPRVGGEKFLVYRHGAISSGSPPRGRGKVKSYLSIEGATGITPAWAGKR